MVVSRENEGPTEDVVSRCNDLHNRFLKPTDDVVFTNDLSVIWAMGGGGMIDSAG